ncbi:MAG: PTS sugar transporter subunit IIA, partial [Faecalibacillus sp.]
HVIKPSICFGRLKNPILWDEEKNEYVKIVILIAVPKNNRDQIHLHIISHLMRQLMHDNYMNKLLNCDESQIYSALKEGLE